MELTLDIIAKASAPGNPERENEDCLDATPSCAWVIDGATSSSKTTIEGSTSAAWFSKNLSEHLKNSTFTNPSHRVKAAVMHVRTLYDALPHDDAAPPSAAIGMISLTEGRGHFLALGDVSILLQRAHAVTVLHEVPRTNLERSLSQQIAEGIQRHENFSDVEERVFSAIEKRRRTKMNKEGGFWIVSIHPEAIDHAHIGTFDAKAGDRILIASDGFTAATQYGVIDSYRDILDNPRSLNQYIDKIRLVEQEDSDMSKFPRVKLSDDASALVVDIVEA